MKITSEDKKLIKAFVEWNVSKGYFPTEYQCSMLIENTNCDHRFLMDEYLDKLRTKFNADDL